MEMFRSRSDIRCLKVLSKVATMVALLPPCNFKNMEIISTQRLYKCFAGFAITGLIVLQTWAHIEQTVNISGLSYFTVALNIVSLTSYLTTNLKANFIDKHLWSKCLIHLRTALNTAQLDVREPVYLTVDFAFFGCLLFYGAICIVTITVLKTDCDIKAVFVDILVNFSQIVVTNIICNITEMVKLCFKQLESILEEAFQENYADNYTIFIIRTVKASYLEINFVIDCQETLFGMTVALLYLRTVVAVVFFLATAVNGDGTTMYLLSRLFIYSIIPIVISFCCDSAKTAAEDLTDKCFELDIRTYTSTFVESEMESLKNLLMKQKPNFTAGGLFTTNRSTLLSTFSAAATYFIVFLQFWRAGS